MYIPTILESDGRSLKQFDLPSRLLKDNIILLNGEIDDFTAYSINMQLLYLNSLKDDRDIYLYINSPGGIITSGLSMYDTIYSLDKKVNTVCVGQACSMGAFLLATGTGKRVSLPNSRIMIHQPLGGASGQATDIQIQAKEIQYLKEKLARMLSDTTKGKVSYEKMLDITERDNFLSPENALELGLIDKILPAKHNIKTI